MNAKTLSLGNWVQYGDEIFEITMISTCFVWNDEQAIAIEHLEPIPLTPEILKKAGFHNYGSFYAIKKQYKPEKSLFRLTIVDWEHYDTYTFNNIHIQHLHTLQNLYFMATGTELNIEL